jgi:hypothetical protein
VEDVKPDMSRQLAKVLEKDIASSFSWVCWEVCRLSTGGMFDRIIGAKARSRSIEFPTLAISAPLLRQQGGCRDFDIVVASQFRKKKCSKNMTLCD